MVADVKAGAFRASIVDKAIAVDFGQGIPGAEKAVQLTNRVLMDPVTVMKLVSALRVCMRDHDAKWGNLANTPTAAPTRSHAEPEAAAGKAGELFRAFDSLHVTYIYERSFRMSHQALAANRFLLSVGRSAIHGDFRTLALGIFERLGMPEPFLEDSKSRFEGVRALHLGFEGDERVLFKCYLEYDPTRSAAPEADSALLHLAYKWDTADPGHRVTSRYMWHRNLTPAQILRRLGAIYDGADSPSLDIARGVLDVVDGRINNEDMQYLEVMEGGNERRSFDLNFYDAGLLVKDLQGPLARMREHFDVRPGQYQALYDQIKSQPAGHLAGGRHRDGRDFFNVYHGAQKRRG